MNVSSVVPSYCTCKIDDETSERRDEKIKATTPPVPSICLLLSDNKFVLE